MEHSGSDGGIGDSPRSRASEQTSLDNCDRSLQMDSNSIPEYGDNVVQISPATANGATDTQAMAPDATFEEAMEFMKS
jgi:hypothetical protein